MLLTEIATLTDIRCDCCKYSTGSNHPEDCFDTPETTPCKRRLEVAKRILSKILEAVDGAGLTSEEIERHWTAVEGMSSTHYGILLAVAVAQLQAIKKLFEVEK